MQKSHKMSPSEVSSNMMVGLAEGGGEGLKEGGEKRAAVNTRVGISVGTSSLYVGSKVG